jgi:hypothetical protein
MNGIGERLSYFCKKKQIADEANLMPIFIGCLNLCPLLFRRLLLLQLWWFP